MKNRISENFHVPLNSLSSVKTGLTAKQLYMGGGGGRLGVPQVGTRDPQPWLGGPYKKKILHDPSPNTHTVATIRKEVLTPPRQKGVLQVRGGGGTGVKIKEIIGGSFLVMK